MASSRSAGARFAAHLLDFDENEIDHKYNHCSLPHGHLPSRGRARTVIVATTP